MMGAFTYSDTGTKKRSILAISRFEGKYVSLVDIFDPRREDGIMIRIYNPVMLPLIILEGCW